MLAAYSEPMEAVKFFATENVPCCVGFLLTDCAVTSSALSRSTSGHFLTSYPVCVWFKFKFNYCNYLPVLIDDSQACASGDGCCCIICSYATIFRVGRFITCTC